MNTLKRTKEIQMLYKWKDSKSGTEVWVSRSMKDYNKPPTEAEAIDAGLSSEEFKSAVFTKIITGGAFSRGFGAVGKGSKGNW